MAIYFIADWWLISGIESGISWLGNQLCLFPQRRCCRRIQNFLETSVSEDLNLVLEESNLGFWFSWREKHTKSFFFTHHGCKQVCLWSWLQHSSSPFLCLGTSLQLNTPPLCLAILPIPFSLSPQSVLSPAISSSLQILSDFANLPDKKDKRFSQSVMIQEAVGVSLLSLESTCFPRERQICTTKALWRMHAQGGSDLLFVSWSNSSPRERRNRYTTKALWKMHAWGVFSYLSLEVLLQGKEENDCTTKALWECMHKEGMFSYCTLKHFFSKGKRKKMHTKALWRQQEEFSYCPLQHFYEGRKKERWT